MSLDDLPELISECKDIICYHVHYALVFHRLELICRKIPSVSWRSDPWLRIRLRWYQFRHRSLARKGLRLLDRFDPEWSRRARARFQQELDCSPERLPDGSVIVAKGIALKITEVAP